MKDADDIEAELQKAMDEAEAAIGKSNEAIESRGPGPGPKLAAHEFGEGRSPEVIVREMVAEAMADERASWQGKVDAAQAEAQANYEKLLRSMAEFANYKRRSTSDVEQRVHSALGRLLEDFLPLGDNLSRAKSAVQGDERILEGIAMVEQSFFGALAKHDIAPVLALGCSFNPEIHEAVAQQPNDAEYGVIVEEFEKGYTWRGKLLRPARVVVSMGKPETE